MKVVRWRILPVAVVLAAYLTTPTRADARPILIDSFPAPDETLDQPPEEVRLTFNEPINPDNLTLVVVDAVGMHVDNADAHVPLDSPSMLVVSLPPLDEGFYTVTYAATDVDDRATLGGNYHFTLQFPAPHIRIVSPPDGAGFEGSDIRVEVDTGDFDLAFWEHAWRLYVDGEAVVTTQENAYALHQLGLGVHELRIVLVDADGVELHDTGSTSFIAVGRTDEEALEIEIAARAPGDPGLMLERGQVTALALVALAAIGVGVLLGRRRTSRR